MKVRANDVCNEQPIGWLIDKRLYQYDFFSLSNIRICIVVGLQYRTAQLYYHLHEHNGSIPYSAAAANWILNAGLYYKLKLRNIEKGIKKII